MTKLQELRDRVFSLGENINTMSNGEYRMQMFYILYDTVNSYINGVLTASEFVELLNTLGVHISEVAMTEYVPMCIYEDVPCSRMCIGCTEWM